MMIVFSRIGFRPFAFLAFLAFGLLSSCGMKGNGERQKAAKIPRQLLGGNRAGNGENPKPVGELKAYNQGGAKFGEYELPSDDDIVWSDEARPEADINFEKPFLKPKKVKGAWRVSFSEARREANLSGNPVLVWFTDNGTPPSPVCKILSRELFSTPPFKDWAKEKVVPLRLDLSAGEKGIISSTNTDNMLIRKKEYLAGLKERYKVMGLPTVLLLAPSGEVISKYRGYKAGEAEFYWGRLKHSVAISEDEREAWQEKMKAKGYREWQGKNGVALYAKLLRYVKGEMLLVEPDGKRIETDEEQLSFGDRLWINTEKEKRGLE